MIEVAAGGRLSKEEMQVSRFFPSAEDYEAAKADPAYATATDAGKYKLAQEAMLERLHEIGQEIDLVRLKQAKR